jgi:putative chitinase
MEITLKQIKAIMPNVVGNISKNPNFQGFTADSIVVLLNRYAKEFDINTPLRWRHYLSQIAHESAEMRYSEELASGKAYDTGKLAIRLGNTPQADGDGQKYKGRGLIQLTGLANYKDYKKYCGFDVVADPKLLAKPVGAIRSSMWFWKTKGLNVLADKDDFLSITKRINGGTNGLSDRKKYLDRAKTAIPA